VHSRKLPVGLVPQPHQAMDQTSQQALQMLAEWPYPVVAQLRDSQSYVVATGLGRSLFDYRSAQVREHQADWAAAVLAEALMPASLFLLHPLLHGNPRCVN
jgi:chromosome partitioning protein